MIRSVRDWLGVGRFRLLVGLLVITGIASLILQAAFPDESWSLGAQTALVLVFLLSAFTIVGGVLAPETRNRLAFIVLPALAAAALGVMLIDWLVLFLGAAVGWLIAAQLLLRNPEKREYKLAIRALRKSDYPQAIAHMNALIAKEPKVPQHYGFRAQLHRLNDDLRRAARDYEKVIALDPDSSVGANGMAEVCLQKGDLKEARRWGELAYQKAPNEWVAVYNLGMIAERQKDDEAAMEYLHQALALHIPDSRHRLLTYLWLARICQRTGKTDEAEQMVKQLRKEKKGLREWETILESQEAASLRLLLQQDVRSAKSLAEGQPLEEALGAAR